MEHSVDSRRLRVLRHSAYDVASVRAMERPMLERGVPLMDMAARATAHVVLDLLDEVDVDAADAGIVVLAGAGDNGGDGLYAAAQLARQGASVTAVAVGKSLHDEAFAAFMQAGGKVLVLDQASDIPGCASGFSAGEAGERLQTAIALASGADVLLDAMTGIGVHGGLHGIPAAIAEALGYHGEPPDRPAVRSVADIEDGDTPLVVAVDTPSGIGVDEGTLPGAYIPADATVMFGALKPCAMMPPASYACGELTLVDFGFDVEAQTRVVRAVDDELAAQSIRLPQLTDSKYSRGVVGLITGSERYPGAGVLTTSAAAHTNPGMVRYLGPARVQDMVLARTPEAVIGKGRVESWVVGSGVPSAETADTQIDVQRSTIAALLAHYDIGDHYDIAEGTAAESARGDLRAGVGDESHPTREAYDMPALCVDAGALDLLPERVPAHVVITPHAGELAQLLSLRGEALETEDVLNEPWKWARRAHEITGATVLLKGAITVVVGEDEGGHSLTFVCGSAPAWLGTAGAGDVLSGVMGALLAQQDGMLQEDCAVDVEVVASAAYIHARAAAQASQSTQQGWKAPAVIGIQNTGDIRSVSVPDAQDVGRPIVASDLIAAIPAAVAGMLE